MSQTNFLLSQTEAGTGPDDGKPLFLSCVLKQTTAPRRSETQSCLPVSLQMPGALKVRALGAPGRGRDPIAGIHGNSGRGYVLKLLLSLL